MPPASDRAGSLGIRNIAETFVTFFGLVPDKAINFDEGEVPLRLNYGEKRQLKRFFDGMRSALAQLELYNLRIPKDLPMLFCCLLLGKR